VALILASENRIFILDFAFFDILKLPFPEDYRHQLYSKHPLFKRVLTMSSVDATGSSAPVKKRNRKAAPIASSPVRSPALVKGSRAALAKSPVKLLGAREIMLNLHNEHKYMSKLLNVLREQMELIDKGETPDLAIMADITRYMGEYSDASHHPKEDVIYRKLSESNDANKLDVVSLLIDHEASAKKTETLLRCIHEAQLAATRENLKLLRLRAEDYIATLNRHMDLEESQVFPRVLEALSDEDWADIINEIQPDNDPLFGRIVEQRYHDLHRALASELERAAEDFAMAELVGLGAAMENIGAIATYGNSIGKVVSRHFREAYKGNAVAFRKLRRSKSGNAMDYVSVTIDCMLNNFDTYTDALRDIGRILRKARAQIAEPYTTRLKIYHDMSRPLPSSEQLDGRR
jgi:hemerythrin-like domain-containing protein